MENGAHKGAVDVGWAFGARRLRYPDESVRARRNLVGQRVKGREQGEREGDWGVG